MPRLATFAWTVLGYNLAVIGWGAYVRATGSGAGCGSHWPLCNGEVLPRGAAAATLVEFSHRLSSGVALLAVVALAVWTYRTSTSSRLARRAASASLMFIVLEAAVGAGLVLFELVADNATMARAMFMAVHLMNTFFLLAALTLTAWWLSPASNVAVQPRAQTAGPILLASVALLLTGASGAVAALGDTLFPAASLEEALRADLSASSHVLLRLRLMHPVIAVVSAALVIMSAATLGRLAGSLGPRLSRAIAAVIGLQLALGFFNVVLLAPVALQLAHLFVADAIWILFVVLAAEALARAPVTVAAPVAVSRTV